MTQGYIWTFDLVNPLVLRHKGLFISTMLQKTKGLLPLAPDIIVTIKNGFLGLKKEKNPI